MRPGRAGEIGARIVAFLRDALVKRVPDRDRARSEEIRREMLEALPVSVDDAAWRAWVAEIAAPVAQSFAPEPERWESVVDLVSIYFRSVRTTEAHPRADAGTITGPDGVVARTIQLDLAPAILRGLFQAMPGQRARFFERVETWNGLRATTAILGEVDLDAREAFALILRIDTFRPNDLARIEPVKAASAWITAHVEVGREIVEAWLRKEPWTEGLRVSAVQLLVEGVVRAGQGHVEWRDGVLRRLAQEADDRLWALAAWLACFAWPEPQPPARIRHDALLQEVRRLPSQLVGDGLRALARDAGEHPQESVETMLRLLEMVRVREHDRAKPEAHQQRAVQVATVAWRAVAGARKEGSAVPDVRPLLPFLVAVPVAAARWDLDHLLHELVAPDEALVKEIASRWIAEHVQELHEQHLLFDDAFPTLAHRLSPDGIARWLIALMVDPDGRARRAAAGFLGRMRAVRPPEEVLESLSADEVDALAHELFGNGVAPEVLVPLLFGIAERRPDRLDVVRRILLEDVAEDYPGACRRATQAAPKEGAPTSLEKLRRELRDQLERADALYTSARGTPELMALRAARRPWHAAQNRVFQEGERDARNSGRYPLLSFLQRVPIPRGEATAPEIPGAEPTRFGHYSGTMELPRRELIDPLTFRYHRLRHRREAEELLARREAAS